MSTYVRPHVPDQVFYDTDGRVVDYGDRWNGQSPPAETYSIDEDDGGRLHVLVNVESAPMPRLTLRRVYDAVLDVEAP